MKRRRKLFQDTPAVPDRAQIADPMDPPCLEAGDLYNTKPSLEFQRSYSSKIGKKRAAGLSFVAAVLWMVSVGADAQASAVRFSSDQQNGGTPEEGSRSGKNHAMIQKDA
jgi:hypothetical protein